MRTYFGEVLARERVHLAGITDRAMLTSWRHRIVEELMTPQSPYALALRQTGDVRDRSDFLDQWRELLAEALDRLLRSGVMRGNPCPSPRGPKSDVDPQKTAVLILAALHGGSTLSQIAQDPLPLNAALDLALVSFEAGDDDPPARTGTSSSIKWICDDNG
ncbi:hypothetical protein AB4Y87_14675 [Paenarthrobacter sp. RAF54_2]|uniref:hypothetical protein n=1 Tax=Paenarthrobacter sp. RAF54_2 TaxID=3233061 RepID=UPI003F9CA867